MKSLFFENRMANILTLLRRSNEIKIEELADVLNVSERSIRNDIKQINEEMEDCAFIDVYRGKYVLRIYQEHLFRKKFSMLIQSDEGLNSPRNRMNYIFGKLMRADGPLLTDDLAYEMNVGRTTMIADLKKLRQDLSEYDADIIGKTSKGISLVGPEMGIRKYIMDNNYEQIYDDYPLDDEIVELLHSSLDNYSLSKKLKNSLIQFITLMLDRFLTGHYIGTLKDSYYLLTSRSEYKMVDTIMDSFEDLLNIEIPVEERIYAFLPVAGMRTPKDIKDKEQIILDESIRPLMLNIIEEIRESMNITIHSGDLTEEFLYHMMFMINRLRFGVKVNNPHLQDLKKKYPLAYQMAGIAARVIESTYQLNVSLEEKGFLAFYFEVFLNKDKLEQNTGYSIALINNTGNVSSRLIFLQLKKIVDSSTDITLLNEEQIDSDTLNSFDLILTTYPLDIPCEKPVIKINEIFDEQDLLQKIEKLRYWDHTEVSILDNNWFVMPGLLDKSKFFYLDGIDDYNDAVDFMIDRLTRDGYVDDGFAKRLAEREAKGTMVFGNSIAIPHCIQQADDRIVLAVGILPKEVYYNGQEIRFIFLIGIPNGESKEEGFLIRVYDELMSISLDGELIEKLGKVKRFNELMRVLYRHS